MLSKIIGDEVWQAFSNIFDLAFAARRPGLPRGTPWILYSGFSMSESPDLDTGGTITWHWHPCYRRYVLAKLGTCWQILVTVPVQSNWRPARKLRSNHAVAREGCCSAGLTGRPVVGVSLAVE